MEWLEYYRAARGYQIATTVKEIATRINDARPKFLALLSDTRDYKDRGGTSGSGYAL
jgi:hypothetical protein